MAVLLAGTVGGCSALGIYRRSTWEQTAAAARILVSGFSLGDVAIGDLIAQRAETILVRRFPPGSSDGRELHIVTHWEVDRILMDGDARFPWTIADLRALQRIINVDAEIKVNARRQPDGRLVLAPVVVPRDSGMLYTNGFTARDVDDAADQLAARIISSRIFRPPYR